MSDALRVAGLTLAFAAVFVLALTLPTGHFDPCRALYVRAMQEAPPPVMGGLAGQFVAAADVAMFHRVAQNGPIRCTVALMQRAMGEPVTVIR